MCANCRYSTKTTHFNIYNIKLSETEIKTKTPKSKNPNKKKLKVVSHKTLT